MILLDTNVISEVMRPMPSPSVLRWLAAQPSNEVATTTINVAEIRYGLARLPFGQRRSGLEARFGSFIARGFANRVFDFGFSGRRSLWRTRRRARTQRPEAGGV